MRGALMIGVALLAGCKKKHVEEAPPVAPEKLVMPPRPAPPVPPPVAGSAEAPPPVAIAPATTQPCHDRGGALRDLVYLVSTDDDLWSFDPKKLPDRPSHDDASAFTKLAPVHCEPGGHPFAMTVDWFGNAWVEYKSGRIYPVSLADGTCGAGTHPDGAPTNFSMAVVGDTAYAAGFEDGRTFGRLHLEASPPTYERIGTVKAVHEMDPDLTGTNDGRLWGFYPERRDVFVQQIDPATGAAKGRMHNLPFADVNTYATARYGAVIYLFVHIGSVPALYALNTKADDATRIIDTLPFVAIGAGVSPCAPTAPE